MTCPICRKEVARDDAEFPFCSERCRIIDLGNWASGKYVISSPVSPSLAPEKNQEEEHEE
jgi:endogenous inhibitor of DNA gyrase (YacG/DUF329 family)